MINIGDLAKLNPNQVLASVLATLVQIRDEIKALRETEPPKRPEDRPVRYTLSSAGNRQTQTIPIAYHVTGLLIGSDSSGRGVLQVGSDAATHVFWTLAFQEMYVPFSQENRIVVEGGTAIQFIPPSPDTNWDVTLIGHAKAFDR